MYPLRLPVGMRVVPRSIKELAEALIQEAHEARLRWESLESDSNIIKPDTLYGSGSGGA